MPTDEETIRKLKAILGICPDFFPAIFRTRGGVQGLCQTQVARVAGRDVGSEGPGPLNRDGC
jgi:hypothetical protein